MKAQEQIVFLADLLNLIDELQDLVRDYCRVLTEEQNGCMLEDEPQNRNVSF